MNVDSYVQYQDFLRENSLSKVLDSYKSMRPWVDLLQASKAQQAMLDIYEKERSLSKLVDSYKSMVRWLKTSNAYQAVLDNYEKVDSFYKLVDSYERMKPSAGLLDALEVADISKRAFEFPQRFYEVPQIVPIRIPNPREQNSYQSADALVNHLADTIAQWREQVADDKQPAILAILSGGVQINVDILAAEGFHMIRVEGTIDGGPCMLLTHQSAVQLLCYIAKVEKEDDRRKIGFIIDGEERQA